MRRTGTLSRCAGNHYSYRYRGSLSHSVALNSKWLFDLPGKLISMAIILGESRYGKSRVRLMKVRRGSARHEVFEWNVEVWLSGDFARCFVDGDNSHILPTDTMKNTVYSLARSSSSESMEDFGTELVSHFLSTTPYADTASVRI